MKVILLLVLIFCSCFSCRREREQPDDRFLKSRTRMVKTQIAARGITDKRVLEAMIRVPRHQFVPKVYRYLAYSDRPLPIGEEQTISQPYIVALMTEALGLKGGERVLEIGTGSGYQAAVLAEIVKEVYTIEINERLGESAQQRLKQLGYNNVKVKVGDGYLGWPEYAPFDGIIVTCAPEEIPQPLVEQLAQGGKMVIPMGKEDQIQTLFLLAKQEERLKKKVIIPVRFVPMTGEAQRK